MNWPSPTRKEGLERIDAWFLADGRTWDPDRIEPVHRELAVRIRNHLDDLSIGQDWKTDAKVAMALYRTLEELPPARAADPRFWEWINIQVIPDLLCGRWEINAGNYRNRSKLDRFLAARRNWSGSLWWTVHLVRTSGPEWVEETSLRLSGMTVDDVIAVVERPGQHGYRIGLMRHLMGCVLASRARKPDAMLIRRVMLLHSLRTASVVPELAPGGLEGFARSLVIDAGGIA